MSRVAVVTGGTRGIGAEISRALHKAGYRTIATYARNAEQAKTFTDECGVPTAMFDVGNFASCKAGVEAIVAEHGPIDVLVNNAGITRDVMLHRMPEEAWHEVVDTNMNSLFNMCRLVINGMRDRGFGRIVNIGSINGQAGQLGQTNYAAAKAGMIGFSKALALENASKGITVNVICPGYIDTEMVQAVPADIRETIRKKIPVGRFGQPDEIARAVLFLVADGAGFVTGSTMTANGGQYMH
jgi:acetoacetyl-CoA reductase